MLIMHTHTHAHSELSIKLEKSEEDIVRIKQVLKETSAKQQVIHYIYVVCVYVCRI